MSWRGFKRQELHRQPAMNPQVNLPHRKLPFDLHVRIVEKISPCYNRRVLRLAADRGATREPYKGSFTREVAL